MGTANENILEAADVLMSIGLDRVKSIIAENSDLRRLNQELLEERSGQEDMLARQLEKDGGVFERIEDIAEMLKVSPGLGHIDTLRDIKTTIMVLQQGSPDKVSLTEEENRRLESRCHRLSSRLRDACQEIWRHEERPGGGGRSPDEIYQYYLGQLEEE